MTHYQRTLHVETLKKNGVVKLVKDIPPPTNPSSKTSPKNGVKIISLKDFIVLDEVGETVDADVCVVGIGVTASTGFLVKPRLRSNYMLGKVQVLV